MRRYVFALALGASLTLGALAYAQDAAPIAASSDVEEAPTNTELLAELAEIRAAYEKLRDRKADGLSTWLAIAGVGAAIAAFLFGVAKRLESVYKKRKWIPLVSLGLGVLVGFFTFAAAGASVWQAMIVGAGPPFSVFLRELLKKKK